MLTSVSRNVGKVMLGIGGDACWFGTDCNRGVVKFWAQVSIPTDRLPDEGGRGETNGLWLGARSSWNFDTGG